MPQIGLQDAFEQHYTNRLKTLLSEHGLLIGYEADRAAIDLGLHLFEPARPGAPRQLGQVRVWFQLKGVRAETIDAHRLADSGEMVIGGLAIDHLRYWFAHPEPVYLIVYVEALDRFLAEDVRVLVEREGGPRWLEAIGEQKTATLHLPLDAGIDRALERMPRHRSLRLDGPEFRGRPLGHRMDPLRSELEPLSPDDFEALVARLLDAHNFRPQHSIDFTSVLDAPVGALRAEIGRLYLTYEWTTPLETEFGMGPDDDFRIEARPISAQGKVLIVVHSEPLAAPRRTEAATALIEQLGDEEVERVLVFFNDSDRDHGLFGGWRTTLRPLVGVPQGLGSLAFNVLTSTNVYLEFLDRLDWRYANYL
jgi:hypothetical protein